MTIEPVTNPFFLIPTGIIVVLDILSLPLYLKWIKNGNVLKARWLLALKPFSTAVCIYFMFTQFGGGFFWGALYLLVSPIAALTSFVIFLIQIIKFLNELGFPSKNYIFNFLGGLAIVISLALPPTLYSPIKDGCADANSPKVLIISKALDKYFQENGNYPKTIDGLSPSFLPVIPSPSCKFISGFSNPFILNTCNPERPYIYTHTLDGMGFEYYSLKDGTRARQHSFLDGGPDYCP